MSVLDGKTILLTGGTGSFGNAFTRIALEEHNPKAIRIFSRGEMLQTEMERRLNLEIKLVNKLDYGSFFTL